MTKLEALVTLFDTAIWAIENNVFNDEEKSKLKQELKAIIEAFEHKFAHEHYRRINGIWTHSGSFDDCSIVNNCENKRKSYLVVLRGAALSIGDTVTLLNVGNWIELQPHEIRSGIVKEGSRIMRIFVNTESELKTFLGGL